MKQRYKTLATALAATLQLALHAAVPVAWTNSPGMPPYPIKPVPHGSTVDLAVTLKGYTTPPIADGADVRLWYQTNGMGTAWWSAPATFDGGTITATFGPAQDSGADRVSLFFGAPSNVFATAVLRLTHAPGFTPSSLPLPVPTLDFAAVELRNLSALTNGWSFGSTIDLTDSTNYTDSALGTFAATGTVARALSYGTPTRWTDATGCVWEAVFEHFTDWAFSGVPDGYVFGLSDYNGSLTGSWWLEKEGGGEYYQDDFFAEEPDSTDLSIDIPNGIIITCTRKWVESRTNLVGRVALTNDIPDVSGYATQLQSTNAAVAVADAKISTNNAAFVSAVLAVPLTGADAGDLAEIAEYGGYGTVGAAIVALIAGLAALKRRVTSAETALTLKADATDLPYRLVVPGEWVFSGFPVGTTGSVQYVSERGVWGLYIGGTGPWAETNEAEDALELTFNVEGTAITATRASLPGHLLDRASNLMAPTGDATLTLPAAVPGYMRDLIVRLDLTALATAPEVTFAAPSGDTITWDSSGDPSGAFAAGTHLLRLTEVAQGVFHAEDMMALVGLEAALAAINGGNA